MRKRLRHSASFLRYAHDSGHFPVYATHRTAREEETTKYTKYTKRGTAKSTASVEGNHRTHRKRTACGEKPRILEILEILEKGQRKGLPAWGSRCGAVASLSVGPQSAASPYPSRIPVASRDTPSQTIGLQTMRTPRCNKQLHAIPILMEKSVKTCKNLH